MASLTGQSIASSYEQILHVDNDGGGNSTTHVSVKDGDNGTTFGFTIASDALMMTSTNRLEFGDTGTYINQSSNGVLNITSDSEVEINATTIDINGAVAMDGAMTGGTNITISGELDAATLDISGNADIDGTLEADAYTVDGTALSTYIRDTVGTNMLSSNTESGITVTYDTSNDNIDFSVDAAQTGITSLLATDIKIGEDDQTKIDFETADEIHFYAANVEQVYVADNIFGPQSDSDVDLGSTGVRWKDAFVDSLTVTSNIDIDGVSNLDNTDIDGTLVVDGSNISLDSTSTLNIDNSNTSNGITIGTATSGVPISIGHSTSETTINDNLVVTGDLTVNGTNFIVNSTTMQVDDKLIEIAHSPSGSEGNDSAVDGGGIILKSSDSDKSILW